MAEQSQMVTTIGQISISANGLDDLKIVDKLYIKQIRSLTEGIIEYYLQSI